MCITMQAQLPEWEMHLMSRTLNLIQGYMASINCCRVTIQLGWLLQGRCQPQP